MVVRQGKALVVPGHFKARKMMKKLLFVCVENSCRSQMAEAFAHIHGQKLVEVYSAGSKASGVVNKKAIKSMQAIGYDLSLHESKSLQEIPDIYYDYAITMGCGDECPDVRAKNKVDWAIPDPKYMDSFEFNKVRDIIENQVTTLIQLN